MSFRASAPGSLMVMGEYAVVSGHPCLVMAINHRIRVQLIPRNDDRVCVFSSLAHHHTNTHTLCNHPKLRFIMTALQTHQTHLPSGCDIHVYSDFSSQLGLGSSAAITASLCHVLAQWCGLETQINTLWNRGISIIHAVQGKGSGADLAASLHGGLITFSNNPFAIDSFEHVPFMSAYYSGAKQSTPDALKKQHPAPDWDERMNDLTQKAAVAIRTHDWNTLGLIMEAGNSLLCKRGVCSENLNTLIKYLKQRSLKGIKISGAGYGDCVIALGNNQKPLCLNQDTNRGFRELPLRIDTKGVCAC